MAQLTESTHSPSVCLARRRFIAKASTACALAVMPCAVPSAQSSAGVFHRSLGDGDISVLSDGHMELPISILVPEGSDRQQKLALLRRYQLSTESYTPDCNVTLWRHANRLVLFDVGAGQNFMPTTGLLPARLAAAGIDPADITDVVFTHAHPDHLWGLLDEFDDLLYSEAAYHIHQRELDYWLAEDTLHKTPAARQSFVVGAQNRLPLIQEKLTAFNWGDEILPGIEAMDTRGHTPGHTSFAIHQDRDSVLVVGDALVNIAFSFQQPRWPFSSDQDQLLAVKTRLSMLDRLATDNMKIVAYHLPTPGLGHVEAYDGAYRFISGA